MRGVVDRHERARGCEYRAFVGTRLHDVLEHGTGALRIADLDEQSLAGLDRLLNLKGRMERDGWVAAAKQLVEGQAA